jgi:hypothetical protein
LEVDLYLWGLQLPSYMKVGPVKKAQLLKESILFS